jgi:hypothetical protein
MHIDDLNAFSFIHSHNIVLNSNGRPSFERVAKPAEKASIYVWLTPIDDNNFTVLYCGKAGYGVHRRMTQHANGFKHSGTGQSNQDFILQMLELGKPILVFARESATEIVFGVRTSLYSVEEEAMCDAFSPLWNRAKFPSSKTSRVSQSRLFPSTDRLDASFADLSHGAEVRTYLNSLDEQQQTNFLDLVQRLSTDLAGDGVEQKMVRGYSSQPKGYSNIPMLVFCRRTKSGKATPNGWYARVPLVEPEKYPMTVFLNANAIAADAKPTLFNEAGSYFTPKDLKHFLKYSHLYLAKL